MSDPTCILLSSTQAQAEIRVFIGRVQVFNFHHSAIILYYE